MPAQKIDIADNRMASRYRTDFTTEFRHRRLGELKAHVVNISAQGLQMDNCPELQRGERVELFLPGLGLIDAHMVWQMESRAGFQFERIIRLDDFMALIKRVKAFR